MNWLRHTYLVLEKDLRIESRRQEQLVVAIAMALLLSVLLGFGVGSAFLPIGHLARLYSPLVWIIFLVTATLAIGRSLDYELEARAVDTLRIDGISPSALFLAKAGGAAGVALVAHAVAALVLALLLDIALLPVALPFTLLSLAVALGYSALTTVLVALSAATRLRALMLPILLLPLAVPLFFCAIELSHQLFIEGQVALESPWLSLLVVLDVMYLLLGINLYEHALFE